MKVLCKCGKYACADSDVSYFATCGHCGRQWSWINSENENDWTLVHEPPIIAYLTAQRDRLAGLLREALDEFYDDDEGRMSLRLSRKVAAALSELNHPTPTAPTNGEGDKR